MSRSRKKAAAKPSENLNPPNRELKRERDPDEIIDDESPAKKAKTRAAKQISTAMKKAVAAKDVKKFADGVNDAIAGSSKRNNGFFLSKHLLKGKLKSLKTLHYLATLEGYRDAIKQQRWKMVDIALEAILKLRQEEVRTGDTYFASIIPLVTLENLHIHHVTRLIQLGEIDFESLHALVLHYDIDLTKPDVLSVKMILNY